MTRVQLKSAGDSDGFSRRILAWFDRHGRKDLPWQQQATPYRVWVSEIMLQQTQVDTVIPYFQRFMARFPDISSLAAASLDEVLHHWAGLGYYARGRNLHRSARLIMERHGGRFPEHLEQVMELPGVGRSTAGAILSLACGQRHAILDGNVKRVLARHAVIDGWPGRAAVLARLWERAEALLPRERVADYNQAMMDLGAMICRRRQPDCDRCPLAGDCQARAQGRQHDYPAPKPRRTLPQRKSRLLVLRRADGAVLLQRRPPTGIWGGLWSLPELAEGQNAHDWTRQWLGLDAITIKALTPIAHSFSHFHLTIHPVLAELGNTPATCVMEAGDTVWYKAGQNTNHGLAAPIQRLLAGLDNPQEHEPQ